MPPVTYDRERRPGGDVRTDGGPATAIEFLDCETVRVIGDFADVVLGVVWWTEPDEAAAGTIREPVGGVGGERTIAASEEFGPFEYGPVVDTVEAFEEGPVVPGAGDVTAENPDYGRCRDAIVASFD